MTAEAKGKKRNWSEDVKTESTFPTGGYLYQIRGGSRDPVVEAVRAARSLPSLGRGYEKIPKADSIAIN
jgi:hypothetical protein